MGNLIMMLFWSCLDPNERDEYYILLKVVGTWVGWCTLKKKVRDITPAPYEPTNEQFLRYEMLAMKGWQMI